MLLISFMGNDGSGKTTLGRKIYFMLKKTYFFKNVEYYSEFNYFILKFFFKFFGQKRIKDARKNFLSKKKGKMYSLWPFVVWFDLLLAYIYYKAFKKDSILILDRYAYDFLMSWEYLGYSNRIIRWIYSNFPRPDLPIILWCNPEIAYERKKSTHKYPLEFYITQTKRYLAFAKNKKIRIINTDGNIDKALNEIIVEINKRMLRKLKIRDRLIILLSNPRIRYNKRDLEEMIHTKKMLNNLTFSDWKYLLKTAIQCNIENIFFENMLKYFSDYIPSNIKRQIKHILDNLHKKIGSFIYTVNLLTNLFEDARINFVIMKTIAPFDYEFTDIDVIVDKTQFFKAKTLLQQIYSQIEIPKNHKAITFKTNNKRLLPIDLHYEVSWNKTKIFDGKEILKSKRTISYKEIQIPVPSKYHEIRILKAHDMYQHHYTTLGVFYWIQKLLFDDILFLAEYPIMWHSIFSFQKPKNLEQLKDLVFFFYRFIRFKIKGTLPYNVVEVKL